MPLLQLLPMLILLALVPVSGCGGGKPSGRPLRVGMELSYPPFEMTDARGEPTGVSPDLARALGEFLNRDVVIENIAFDGLIPALKTGRIDLVISSMTATPARAGSIAFSEPYLRTGLAILAAAGSNIESADDLDRPGRTVAVKKGTTGHLFAREALEKARLLVLDRETAAVMEVVQAKADAFLYDPFSVYRSHRRHPDTTRALLTPFREESWAIGIRRGEEDLQREVNRFLESFRESGGFERLGDRYLPEEKAFFAAEGIPFVF